MVEQYIHSTAHSSASRNLGSSSDFTGYYMASEKFHAEYSPVSNGKFAIILIPAEATRRVAVSTGKSGDVATQPDILIFLSDQHDGRVQAHMGDGILSAEVCRRNIQCDPSGKTVPLILSLKVHPAAKHRLISGQLQRVKEKPRDSREDLVRAVRAAYYGMIEFEDSCVGTVRAAWTDYLPFVHSGSRNYREM